MFVRFGGVAGRPSADVALLDYERCVVPEALARYTVRATLTSAVLKSSCSAISDYVDQFEIVLRAGGSLQFEYAGTTNTYEQSFADDKHIALLRTFADQAAIAIENSTTIAEAKPM